MDDQLRELDDKYRERAMLDPDFYNRTTITRRVLDELDKVDALKGNKSYAAFLVVAALEEIGPHSQDAEGAWNLGFSAATREWLAQRANPDHPITRENPFKQ